MRSMVTSLLVAPFFKVPESVPKVQVTKQGSYLNHV